jgi:hypothetical protein
VCVFVTDGVRNPIDTSLQILPIFYVAKPNELKGMPWNKKMVAQFKVLLGSQEM